MAKPSLSMLLSGNPDAQARIKGSCLAPNLGGYIRFYPWSRGVIIKAELVNLPDVPNAFSMCVVSDEAERDVYIDRLPSFFSNQGYALIVVYTDVLELSSLKNKRVQIKASRQNKGSVIGTGKIQAK